MSKNLRPSNDKMLAGVAGGLADYVGMDHTMARVLIAIATFMTGIFPGVIIYIICAVIMNSSSR